MTITLENLAKKTLVNKELDLNSKEFVDFVNLINIYMPELNEIDEDEEVVWSEHDGNSWFDVVTNVIQPNDVDQELFLNFKKKVDEIKGVI